MKPSLFRRSRHLAWLAGLLVMAMSSVAVAQVTTDTKSATVSTSATDSERMLAVLELTGGPLTAMSLRTGVARPFEVRVTDDAMLPEDDFEVQAVLNNLYLKDGAGFDYAKMIPSDKVDVSFAADPLGALGVTADLNPRHLLSTKDDGISCSTVAGLLSLDLTNLTALLADPVCNLVYEVYDLGSLILVTDRLTALLDPANTISFSGVPIVGDLIGGISLDGLGLLELPLAISGGTDTGAFTNPDCASGIGQDDDACDDKGDTTARTFLTGDTPGDISGGLKTLLEGAVPPILPLVSATGDEARFALDEVRAALALSGAVLTLAAGTTDTTVGALDSRLGQYTVSQQVSLINTLLGSALADLGLDDLLGVSGAYRGFPALKVDTSSTTVAGEYAGTLTVRLLETVN
jgi:hypothetical protein